MTTEIAAALGVFAYQRLSVRELAELYTAETLLDAAVARLEDDKRPYANDGRMVSRLGGWKGGYGEEAAACRALALSAACKISSR